MNTSNETPYVTIIELQDKSFDVAVMRYSAIEDRYVPEVKKPRPHGRQDAMEQASKLARVLGMEIR